MRVVSRWFFFVLFFLALVQLSACGTHRMLQSITVTPATATATQVQFTATGHYNTDPIIVEALPVEWTVDFPPWLLLPQTDNVLIDSNGLARCKAGYTGTNRILAIAPANPNVPIDGTGKNAVIGTAQITCP